MAGLESTYKREKCAAAKEMAEAWVNRDWEKREQKKRGAGFALLEL